MANAVIAKDWLASRLSDDNIIQNHMAALTANTEQAVSFGIAKDHIFPIWDWVGGRYSLWSTIGLPIALQNGFDDFRRLLDGAQAMDTHFKTAPLKDNIPVLLALTGLWNRNFLDYPALAVLPYAQPLQYFPAYLQQLDMESNGKAVDRDGQVITDYKTGPVLFGEPGTNGQHAFYQLLHQGTDIIPCDFIGFTEADKQAGQNHDLLLYNMLAQGQAFMQGRIPDQADHTPHRTFTGNRPGTTILLNRLDPYHLGLLTALYEHKVFVQGVIWNINSFDQFGVELGKELAKQMEKGQTEGMDSSTRTLLETLRQKL